MKTSLFIKGANSLRTVLATAVIGLLSVPSAFSAIVFQDNFNSYDNDADLLLVYNRVTGTAANTYLAPDPVNPANQTLYQDVTAGRLRHEINGGVVPTTAEPTMIFSFDLYDPNPAAGGRVFGEFRSSAAANGLLAAGIYNSSTYGTYDFTKYSARTIDGAGVSKWVSLNTPRSQGWHNFRFEITGSRADLYVDNVSEGAFGDLTYAAGLYDWVNVGSGLSAGTGSLLTGANFDNVSVSLVPEPSVVTLGLLGLGTLLGWRWLRPR